MNSEQYLLQVERVRRYEALNKRLTELNAVIDNVNKGRDLKISAYSLISAPVETLISEEVYKEAIINQLEVMRADLIKEIQEI